MGRKTREERSRPQPLSSAVAAPASTAPRPAQSRPARGAARRTPSRAWIWTIALVAATAAAYAGALDTPFLLDDPINITKNAQIQHPLSAWALATDPRATVTATLRWNYLAGGFEVRGYHILNIAAHALTGCLVFALALATLRLGVFEDRYRRSAAGVAGVAALVFLLHPMQTESVTYVIQRAEIFVSAALAGALLSLAAMKDGATATAMAALVLSCIAGIYSKPSFAVVPALLLVYDLCFVSRGRIALALRQRWPAYGVAAAAALATFAMTKLRGGFEGSTAGFDIEGITPLGYLSAQPGVVVHYLRVALWPRDLCFDCGYRGPWPVLDSVLGDSVVAPALILAAIAAAALVLRTRQPLLALAVFGSAVVLLPTSSVVPLADFYVEHRMYLPIAFLAMALVAIGYDATAALAARVALAPRHLLLARAAASALVVLVLATMTTARNRELGDPIALMEDALAQAPQNERVHYNLANAYKRLGRLEDAIPHYQAAIRLLPGVVRSYQNLGSLYLQQGKLDEALEVFLAGAAAKPELGMAHRNVATTYLRLGRPEEALEAAQRSLRVDPGNAIGARLAGDALLELGRRDEAVQAWRDGLDASPGDAALRERLARAGVR